MKAHEARRLMDAAAGGRRVLVVSVTQPDSQAALQVLLRQDVNAEQVRWRLGGELITFSSGGRIYFASIRSARERGLAVDTVFFDVDADAGPELVVRYSPCISGARDGEIMHAERRPREKSRL